MEEKKDDNILRMLKKLSLTVSVKMDQIFAEDDLTASQIDVLKFLLDHGSEQRIFSTELHLGLGISKSAVSMLLKKLRQKGYITLSPCLGDDRLKRIALTEKTWRLKQKLEEKVDVFQEQLYQGFTEKEYEQLGQSVQRMLTNLRLREDVSGSGQRIEITRVLK